MADTFVPKEPIEAHVGEIDLSCPHFVGIGGAAMSGVALMALAAGSKVTGSDARKTRQTTDLTLAGINEVIGNRARNIEGASCVVYTTVTSDTPEFAAARKAGVPVVHRAQVLNQLCRGKRLVAVIGSHGKSTTTAMLATGMAKLGFDPSYMVGAPILGERSVRIGASDLIIAEIDESDRSFLLIERADMVVVTTLNDDHPETFAQEGEYSGAFADFARRLAPNGTLIANIDDPGVVALVELVGEERPDITICGYGRSDGADWKITDAVTAGWRQTVKIERPQGGTLVLDLCTPARHLGHNAVGALAAGVALGAEARDFSEQLASFQGVERRFERYGNRLGATVIGSFASHPCEIAADLVAAREIAGDNRVIVAFQPSGYGRITKYGKAIGHVLAAGADVIFVLPLHGAGEPEGASGQIIADAIRDADGGALQSYPHANAATITRNVGDGDALLLMGTGDMAALLVEVMSDLSAPVVRSLLSS